MRNFIRATIFTLLAAAPSGSFTMEAQTNGTGVASSHGWNSWNHFGSRVDDATIRAQAEAIVASGMRDAGYIYINIDDTWEGERDAKGYLHTNSKFPT